MQKTTIVVLAVISMLGAMAAPAIADKITADPNAPGQTSAFSRKGVKKLRSGSVV